MNTRDLAPHTEADPLATTSKPGGEGANIFVDLEGRDRSGPEPAAGFGGGSSSKFGNPAIIALVLVVLSAGGIYGMRKIGTISGISGQTLAVEYQPSAINAEFELRFERAMEDLARSGRPLQVAIDEVPAQPFEIDQRLSIGTAIASVPDSELSEQRRLRLEQQRREEQRRRDAAFRERIDEEVARLTVQSMIGGRVPVATINGQLCRVGDEIGNGIFTVDFISGEGVQVVAGDRKFLLRMGKRPEELFE